MVTAWTSWSVGCLFLQFSGGFESVSTITAQTQEDKPQKTRSELKIKTMEYNSMMGMLEEKKGI